MRRSNSSDEPDPLPGSPPSNAFFNPKSNSKYNPLPATSGKCSKLKINLVLNSTLYIAGDCIQGILEVTSLTDNLLLFGEIAVDLSEISGKSFHQSASFLSARQVFQGDRQPPSAAVRGGPLKDGYFMAKKAKTSFPFSFPIPLDSPSSFDFQTAARLRYVLTGSVQFKYGNQTDTIFRSKQARVIDKWNYDSEIVVPVVSVNERKLVFGGEGLVQLMATIKDPICASGTTVALEIMVRNGSRRKVQGIKVSFLQNVLLLCSSDQVEDEIKVLTEISQSYSFKERDFIYGPGEERVTKIHVQVPTGAQTIRNSHLVEKLWVLQVSLCMPGVLYFGGKDLMVELPVKIFHPKSLEKTKIRQILPVLKETEWKDIQANTQYQRRNSRASSKTAKVIGELSEEEYHRYFHPDPPLSTSPLSTRSGDSRRTRRPLPQQPKSAPEVDYMTRIDTFFDDDEIKTSTIKGGVTIGPYDNSELW